GKIERDRTFPPPWREGHHHLRPFRIDLKIHGDLETHPHRGVDHRQFGHPDFSLAHPLLLHPDPHNPHFNSALFHPHEGHAPDVQHHVSLRDCHFHRGLGGWSYCRGGERL